MRNVCILLSAMVLLSTVSCTEEGAAPSPPETGGSASEIRAAPSADQVARATITGIEEAAPVTLVNGSWQGEPFEEGAASRPEVWLTDAEDFWLVGDIDADGVEEAVVHLHHSTGGSGTWGYIAVLTREGEDVVQEAILELGDRVQIREARIAGNQIVLDVMRAGPEDGMCCPSELASLALSIEAGELAVVSDEVTGTVSLESLAGQEWVLRRLSSEESAPAEPEITLMYQDGQISGSSGCNGYQGSAAAGDVATSLEIGPLARTAMACPPEVMDLEQQYLAALEEATDWSLEYGRLGIAYQRDGVWDQLDFEAR